MLFEKTSFFSISHTKFLPPKNPNIMVKKNDFRYHVPSQPVTKHSHIPLVRKRSAREVLAACFLKKRVFFLFPKLNFYHKTKSDFSFLAAFSVLRSSQRAEREGFIFTHCRMHSGAVDILFFYNIWHTARVTFLRCQNNNSPFFLFTPL